MKVLHFGRFHGGSLGGIERHVGLLLTGLAQHMHVDNVVAGPDLHARVFKTDGYTVHQLPSLGKFAGTALCPTMPFYVHHLYNKHKYDIVHLHLPDPMSQLAIAFLPRHVKIVVTWHGDIIRQKKLFYLYRPFLNRLLRRVDAVIAATPFNFSSSTQLGIVPPEKKVVIPFGLDSAPYTDAVARTKGAEIRTQYAGKKIIFAVGRHVELKGYNYLIEAMQSIPNNTILMLGGTGPLTDTLKNQAESIGVQDRVFFTGHLTEDLPGYYHACDLLCMPSIIESFGLVQVEAMFCQKPVVCCELHNGVTYVNRHGETGLVVPPRDPAALAQALTTLLNDDALRARMGQAAYTRAIGEFTLDHMWNGTLDLYRKLIPHPLKG